MGRPTPPALQSRLSRASSSSDLLSPESRRSANPHLRTKGSKRLNSCAAFSPAIAHHELLRGEVAMGVSDEMLSENPAAWGFQAALLFVDISGFTNLCTKLDIDRLQAHINNYFTRLIDVVTEDQGDVVRFAGDACVL
uniref:Guanylate cyclase domain-containing protein n=1 Tax=Haptolina ericina TaxID=156174 RepID=A0A7S3F1Q4_9EUKA|mmetsp:Transcript_46790/g.105512  ORF Transcript_46790/g.105512 Transcript_46790/m.105512 type:complete len:138 (+) Transcript_46790:705-1118(+)